MDWSVTSSAYWWRLQARVMTNTHVFESSPVRPSIRTGPLPKSTCAVSPGGEVEHGGDARHGPGELADEASDARVVTGEGVVTGELLVHRGGLDAGGDPSGGNVAGGTTEDAAHAAHAAPRRHANGLAFVDTGPSGGATFLLLHGFAADHGAFAATTNALARAGCRVVAPDLPAHGETRHEAACVADLATALPDFCRETFGGTPVHIVAHSLGAAPALALARERSLSPASLTLIAPAGIGSAIDAAFIRGMADPASAGELSHLLRRASARAAPLSAEALEALYRTLAAGRLRSLADSLLGTSGQAIDLLPTIGQVSDAVPTRVFIGQRDRIIDPRDALALPSSVAVHHFAESGHMPHWDAPREVQALLLRIALLAGNAS